MEVYESKTIENREFPNFVKNKPRKDIRKEARKLKKMRIHAFKQKLQLPTKQSIEVKKQQKKAERIKKKKAIEKKKRQRTNKKERLTVIKEEEERQKRELEVINKQDNRTIRELEKKLKIKKDKGIPSSFKTDNLDYILNYKEEAKGNIFNAVFEEDDTIKKIKSTKNKKETRKSKLEEVKFGINSKGNEKSTDGQSEINSDSDFENNQLIFDQFEHDNSDSLNYEESEIDQSHSDQSDFTDGENFTDDENLNSDDHMISSNSEIGIDLDDSSNNNHSDVSIKIQDMKNKKNLIKSNNEKEQNLKSKTKIKKEIIKDKIKQNDKSKMIINELEENIGKKSNLLNNISEYKEDIYGRFRGPNGEIISNLLLKNSMGLSGSKNETEGVYVPPGRRVKMEAENLGFDNERKNEKLDKKVLSILNRLNENHMQLFCRQTEELFDQFSRADVCQSIENGIEKNCVDPLLATRHKLPDKCLADKSSMGKKNLGTKSSQGQNSIEHDAALVVPLGQRSVMSDCAMLLAALHSRIGTEVCASFVHHYVIKYVDLFNGSSTDFSNIVENDECGDHRMDNILVLLCLLYEYRVIDNKLIFDISLKLAARFYLKDIQLLILMLKEVGHMMRKNDPISFHQLLAEVQLKSTEISDTEVKKKIIVKNLFEIIVSLKNNQFKKKYSNHDPDASLRRKKMLQNIVKEKLNSSICISLADILNAPIQGKWWLVGSAWKGQDITEEEKAGKNNVFNKDKRNGDDLTINLNREFEKDLILLAQQQNMNTSLRVNIFCTIMTSENYTDAFERLLKLNLKTDQEQEIMPIILTLCLQEKTFNHFYVLLSQQLCSYNRRFMIACKFSIWDKLKEVSGMEKERINHLADFMKYLISLKSLSITTLKAIDFTEIDAKITSMLCRLLVYLLLPKMNASKQMTVFKNSLLIKNNPVMKLSLETANNINNENSDNSAIFKILSKQTNKADYKLLRCGLTLFLQQFCYKLESCVNEEDREPLKIAIAKGIHVMNGNLADG